MAEVTLKPDPALFPPGTKVKIYLHALPEVSGILEGAPPGTMLSESTVAEGGTLTVTGLEEARQYIGWTLTGGKDRYVRFQTGGGEAGLAFVGTDGTVGGTGGSPLAASVLENAATIDLCRQPYEAVPGVDITKKLQEAITALVAAGGGTISISRPGVYLLEGAQVTGEAFGHAYSGQLLLPARTTAEGNLTIRIVGVAPAAKPMLGSGTEKSANMPGVVLKSSATGGKVFDCVPGYEGPTGSGGTFSDLLPIIEDLRLQVPPNPQTWGFDFRGVTRARLRNVSVEPDPTQVGEAELPTGETFGIALPWLENAGSNALENVAVYGYHTGVGFSEHCVFNDVFLGECHYALEAYGTGHLNTFTNVSIEECSVAIRTRTKAESEAAKIVALGQGGAQTHGTIAYENVLTDFRKPVALIEDTESRLHGYLAIEGSAQGQAIIGSCSNIDIANIQSKYGAGGCRSLYPIDNFKRSPKVVNNLGYCAITCHPWRVLESANTFNIEGTEGGTLKAATSANCRAVVPYVSRVGAGTRTIVTSFTTGAASYNVGVIVGDVMAGTHAGNYLFVRLREGKLQIRLGPAETVLAEVGGITSSASYEMSVVVTHPRTLGPPTKIDVFLGAAKALSYALTSANREALEDTQNLERQDGISLNKDLESSFTFFRVLPGAPEPATERGVSGEMVGGEVAIAAPLVTATSPVILTEEGGTPAGLAFIREPGVGMKVTSTVTNTNKVNWQVSTE